MVIIRLENYHYTVQLGFCDQYTNIEDFIKKSECLESTQTRTSPVWHLYYALINK